MRRRKPFMGILLSWMLFVGVSQLLPVHIDGAKVFAEAVQSGDNSLSTLSLSAGTLSPEFQYNIVDYTASVGADVTSVEVSAKPSNEFAVIESVSGNTDLQPGENTISIVVKAQNGVAATYKIVVTREGAASEGTDGAAQEPQADGTEAAAEEQQAGGAEGGITIEGHPFNLAPTVPDEVVPQDFTKTAVTCQGQQVEGLSFDKAELTLVYLTTPSTEVKNMLAVYEGEGGGFYPFRKLQLNEADYFIVLNPPKETGLSQEYTQAEQKVGEFANVPAYVRGGGSDSEGFSLVYGASSYGNKGWYQYDAKESTIQRYNPVGQDAQQAAPVTQPEGSLEPGAEMQSLQKAYTDMEEQFNKHKDSSRKTTAVLIFVIAVLLVVVVNLLLRGKKDPEEPLEEEPDYDDLSEKVREQLKSSRKSRRGTDGAAGHRTKDVEEEPWEDEDNIEPKIILRQQTKAMPELGLSMGQQKAQGMKGASRAERRPEQHMTEKRQPMAGKKQPVAEKRQQAVERQPVAEKRQQAMERKPEARMAPDDDFEVIDLEDL